METVLSVDSYRKKHEKAECANASQAGPRPRPPQRHPGQVPSLALEVLPPDAAKSYTHLPGCVCSNPQI